jgi:PAS domain S-box-containing protein
VSGKKRFLVLLLIMVVISSTATGVTIYALYATAFGQQRMRLVEVAQSRARLMEAVARFDERYSAEDIPGGGAAATLRQIRDAHENFMGFGRTGEFTLAKRDGESIVFLLSHRHGDLQQPHPIPFSSKLGEPMRKALSGDSGTIVGLDYRGELVLAAYEPVSILNLGIVAKIDLAEIREPFIKTGLQTTGLAAVLILLGTLLFLRVGNPIIQRLEESEERFRAIFEQAGVGVAQIVSTTGQFMKINQRYCDIVGYTREEMEQLTFQQITHPADLQADLHNMKRLLEEEIREFSMEKRYVHKDGSIVWVNLSVSPMWDVGEEMSFHIAVVEDITERKRADEALRKAHQDLEKRVHERTFELSKSNEDLQREVTERNRAEQGLRDNQGMLQAVFDGISDPLVLLDRDLKVKMLNKAASSYYRMSKQGKAVGRPCHDGLMGNPEPCARCFILPNIVNGRGGSFERNGIMDEDRLEKVVIYPLEEAAEFSGAIVRISDITEKRLLERRIIQNEKLTVLGLLVASIAHDINNPNNFISFNLPILREYVNELLPIIDDYAEEHPGYELFEMSYPDFREDLLRLMDNVEHGSTRIKDTVSDLREFVRKRQKREESFVDLGDVVEKAVAICSPEITKNARDFEVNIQEGLPKTLTSPEELELVLVHLLINAAHAADKEDSWIKVNVFAREGLSIEVVDNGCGMDEATLKKAFEPLFTTKSSSDGFGLGLYVCNNIVEGMRGSLGVESEPGKGSTFRVILHDPVFEDERGGTLGQTAS